MTPADTFSFSVSSPTGADVTDRATKACRILEPAFKLGMLRQVAPCNKASEMEWRQCQVETERAARRVDHSGVQS